MIYNEKMHFKGEKWMEHQQGRKAFFSYSRFLYLSFFFANYWSSPQLGKLFHASWFIKMTLWHWRNKCQSKMHFWGKKLIRFFFIFWGSIFLPSWRLRIFCCLWSLDKVAKCTHFLATSVTLTTHPEAQKEQSKKLLPAPPTSHFFRVRQN